VITGDEALGTPHRIVNPEALARPIGFSHAVVAAPGRTIYLGGQTAHGPDDRLPEGGIVEQFDAAAANVATALAACGARPEHIVSMQVFVTDAAEYLAALKAIGQAYRRHFDRHYPAMAFFEIAGLFDPKAKVELVCTAVVPP
jgi:enamine deaminase RidA (YjgF/YER057c/UK114 family)